MEEQDLQPTITMTATPILRQRLKYIQDMTGLRSRSAVLGLAVNEMYDRLINQAHLRLEREMKIHKKI